MKGPVARGKALGLEVIKDSNYSQCYWIHGIKSPLTHREANMVLRGYELAIQHQKEKADDQ